jgi:CheY-like chemotaxis protein
LAADTASQGEDPESELKQIIKACDRARQLVSQILTFSRQTEREKIPIELGLLVKEALKLLRASLPATVEFRQFIDPLAGQVMADASQMHQVVMNLCTNAAQSMHPNGGLLEVRLCPVFLDEENAPWLGNLKSGKYIELSVSDTGVGMSSQTMERIFDPFFTTKQRGGGTGLGLSMVHGIVTSHDGMIRADSEQGQGSIFRVYLPALPARVVMPSIILEDIPTGHESILMVDDEELLVDVGCQMLCRLGYRAEGKTDSLEALEAFNADPLGYDLLITDLTMPHLTGLELSQAVLNVRPDLPIILCTGFSEAITPAEVKAMGIKEFIMKPMVKMELAKAVRRVLDGRK